MRQDVRRFVLLLAIVLAFADAGWTQTAPVTGNPPLSTIAGGLFDSVDLANVNVHFSIPVFGRAGKGLPFSYALSYDGLMWGVGTNSQGQQQWMPLSNWGWRGVSEASTGYVTYTYTDAVVQCGSNNVEKETWSSWIYHDSAGTPHPFPGSVFVYDDPGCGNGTTSMTVVASDNSGYVLRVPTVTSGETNVPTTVTSASGISYSPPSQMGTGSGSVRDPNGNIITTTLNGSTTTIVDTLGTTALTISGSAPNNPPTCGPAVTYKYTAPNNQLVSVVVSYLYYVVQTNFGVPGNPSGNIIEYGAQGVCLVNKITLPDSSFYQFGYETTVGSGISGKTTGRIASVTLPTGGIISYSYAGACPYNSSNCMMADGSPSTMTRNLGGGTWTYTRALQPNQSNSQQTATTVVDPAGNETDLNFSGIYVTKRQVYKNNGVSKTILKDTFTCYNGNFTSCPTATVTAPISGTFFYDLLDDQGLYTTTGSSYDTHGLLTYQNVYGYTTGTASIIRGTSVSYSTALCTSSNICDHPASVQVIDAGSTQFGLTNYYYDTRGNATSVQRWVSGSTYLTQQYTYNANGTLNTATDPNGTVTTYGYAGVSCSSAFPTSVSVTGTSVSLTTNYTYNCTGGVVTAVQDPNGATTSTSYTDPYFWHPASTSDPLSNQTKFTYASPVQIESVMTFNAGNSTSDVLQLLDGYGRVILQQKKQGPSSSSYDTVFTNYDLSGRLASQTRPYSSPAWSSGGGGPQTTSTYDALGRPVLVTDAGGGTTGYTYSKNDVLVTVGPGQTFTKQNQYDPFGHLRSVCEVTTAGGSGSCSQQTAANGFLTSYTYDPLGNLTGVTQGGQTRSFTFDGVSRMLSETNPETSSNGTGGTTYYVYDSDATCGNANGDQVKRTDPAGNVSCYAYDGVHRLTSVTYPSGPNAANMPRKDFWYDAASWYGLTAVKS